MTDNDDYTDLGVIYFDIAKEYALNVLGDTDKYCKYEVLACKGFIEDISKAMYNIDMHGIANVCGFAESIPLTPKGEIQLPPWSIFCLCAMFGFRSKETGNRIIRVGYIEVAKKNAKTTIFGVALPLYFLIQEDSDVKKEIYVVSNTLKQAARVVSAAQEVVHRMINKGMLCKDAFRFINNSQEASIYYTDHTGSIHHIMAMPANPSGADGRDPIYVYFDEIHEWKGSSMYDKLMQGGGHTNDMMVLTTTAGNNKYGFCYDIRTYFTNRLEKKLPVDDPRKFSVVYTVDDHTSNVDLMDRSVWRMANPSLDHQPGLLNALESTSIEAVNNPDRETAFRQYHLNQWVQCGGSSDLHVNDFKSAIHSKTIEDVIAEDTECRCSIGIDLATAGDIAAVSCAIRGEDGTIYLWNTGFCPAEAHMHKANRACGDVFQKFVRDGDLVVAGEGRTMDQQKIIDHVLDIITIVDKSRVDIVRFESWMSDALRVAVEDTGVAWSYFKKNGVTCSPIISAIRDLTIDKKLLHDGNNAFLWCVENVRMSEDKFGLLVPLKQTSAEKIDLFDAAMMALSQYYSVKSEKDNTAAVMRAITDALTAPLPHDTIQ